MICVIDKNEKIINILDSKSLAPGRRPYYPWSRIGDTWSDIMPLDYAKEQKRREAGQRFAIERDKVRFINLDSKEYGFDCAPVDIANFMANMERAKILGRSDHKVFIDREKNKAVVSFTVDQFNKVLLEVSEDQFKWYMWYEDIIIHLKLCTTLEEVEKIDVNAKI